jgi:hypothetical protein
MGLSLYLGIKLYLAEYLYRTAGKDLSNLYEVARKNGLVTPEKSLKEIITSVAAFVK